jgi:hypothetical protein
MDIKHLRRDMAAIEGGLWVSGAEVPALDDMRVKVRGLQSKAARDLIGRHERGGMDAGKAVETVLAEYCLVDIENLTSGGEAIPVDEVRQIIRQPAGEPLGLIILDAVRVVDARREADAEAAEKN